MIMEPSENYEYILQVYLVLLILLLTDHQLELYSCTALILKVKVWNWVNPILHYVALLWTKVSIYVFFW